MSQQFKFFRITCHNQEEVESELNRFLRSHRILTVHHEFVSDGESSFWYFAVEYLKSDSATRHPATDRSGKKRIDYKEVLSPEDFSVFAVLRNWRKQTAERAGVPVYTIFTNEQLATIVTKRIHSKKALRDIEGVGEARMEKYGDAVLQVIRELVKASEKTE
jgi:superfamily II DNA helicase RecQ